MDIVSYLLDNWVKGEFDMKNFQLLTGGFGISQNNNWRVGGIGMFLNSKTFSIVNGKIWR